MSIWYKYNNKSSSPIVKTKSTLIKSAIKHLGWGFLN